MGNGTSYDPRMEDLPVFISYPRSGSHWINGLMELYFERPRLRHGPASWFPNRQDYMWFHDHDIHSDLELGHSKVMYLVRDPRDVIFSLLTAEHDQITDELVKEQIDLLKKHYLKYMKSSSCCVVSYHNMKEDPHHEFVKITEWFGQHVFYPMKLDEALHKVSKKRVIDKAVDKRYFNKNMLTSGYEDDRQEFVSKYGKLIKEGLFQYLP